jgi:hypothetical protein
MKKVIVAGSRGIVNFSFVEDILQKNIKDKDVEIVSGMARGVDSLAVIYAKKYNLSLKKFPADWSIGKQAGHIRNAEMANYADMLILIWDGKSSGSKSMLNIAKRKNFEIVEVIC